MQLLDYIVVILYFAGLVAVSLFMSRKIKNSEDMFIAGRNSSWWLSGISTYMTIFSASTFVVWGGVAYKSGLVAVVVAVMLGISSFFVGRWISGRWRRLKIKSPGEYLAIRFGKKTVGFYTIAGIVGRGVHTAVAMYAVAVVMCGLMHLNIWWALLVLGVITLAYTIAGGFLAVLMTDVIQFGVLISVVVFMIPLSFHAVGGVSEFIDRASEIPGFLSGTSETYTVLWLVLWCLLHISMIGGDWPFVQRYISVPTVNDAKKSPYLVGVLYVLTPIIWYLPAMIYRVLDPSAAGLDALDPDMTVLGEGAYVNMSRMVLMNGMLGMMLAAMLSATMSNVSGTLNVFANVFTYEIWCGIHKDASDRDKIKAGRVFTLVYGLIILGIAMLIPFAGGAEKVVVTILTMVLCPLYIPSIWGLFSSRLTGKQLIWAMIVSWAFGFTAKLTPLSDIVGSSLMDSISGCVLPLLILGGMECFSAAKGREDRGYLEMNRHLDPDAEKEPSAQMKRAVKTYSHTAVSCFCITLAAIVLLLGGMLAAGDPKTLEVKNIVLWFIGMITTLIAIYVIYRIIDFKKSNHEDNH